MQAYASFILKRAGWVSLVGTLLSIAGFHYSIELYKNLKTNFEELLPTTARSVVDLNEVRSRLQSIDNLAILVFSEDVAGSKRFVTDLAKELSGLPKDQVASVEYQIKKELSFFKSRQALYMDVADLHRIRKFIEDRITYEKELYNPLNIFSEQELQEPQLDFLALRQKYQGRGGAYERFPDGYYATPDEKQRAVLVYKPSSAEGIQGAIALKKVVEDAIRALRPETYAPDIQIAYTSGVQDSLEEHHALIEDLELSTMIVVVIVALAMLVYFRSFLATIALNVSLFMGVFWTFGASYFAVGYLNANSAFLGSIVIGNGINFGIIFLARYLEERRNGYDNDHSIRAAITHTATSTWTAALAAGLSYGSLILTSFRGFRQFGIIGLIGMVLCWVSSYSLMPAFLTVLDRIHPLVKKGTHRRPLTGSFVAWLVGRFPRPIWIVSVLATLVSVAMATRYSPDILETDLSKLRNKESLERGSAYLSKHLDEIFQRYLTPLAILPKSRDDARKIAQYLRDEKESQGPSTLIASVQTLDDFIPNRQNEKIAILHEIRRLLPPKFVQRLSEKEQRDIAAFLSPEAMHPVAEKDLPRLIIDKFTERDGSVGKLILVEPPLNKETWKGDRLIEFIGELREAGDHFSPGAPVAGTIAITSDMIQSIAHDGPQATFFAFIAVVILVVLLFRNLVTVSQTLFALLLGVAWLAGIILGFNLKINFLNFIALPITFGIGVDYGVNIFQRYREEGGGNIVGVIRQTGGAVLLASFTTIVGYCSLLIAGNQGFVSFGRLAVAGEITCVTAAVISLPAYLLLRHRKQLRRSRQDSAEPAVPSRTSRLAESMDSPQPPAS